MRAGAKVVKLGEPKPVQLSYPGYAAYNPFAPCMTSLKEFWGRQYKYGLINLFGLIQARIPAIIGADRLVPAPPVSCPFSINIIPDSGAPTAAISGKERPETLNPD